MTGFRSTAWAMAFSLAVLARAEGGEALSTEPAGIVPVTGETRLVVRGLEGEIYLGAGSPGELRYASMAQGGKQTPVPIALSLDGNSFVLEAVPGTAPAPRFLQIAVPEGVSVLLEVSDTTVRFRDVPHDVEIRGSRVAVSGRGIEGSLTLDLHDGAVDASAVSGDVAVHGTDLGLKLSGTGPASLDLTGGSASIEDVRGRMTATLGAVAFRCDGVRGPATIRASGGTVFAGELGGESILGLKRTPAEIRGNAGDVEVTTDAELKFADLRGPLHVDSYGGAVTGSGAGDLLEVRSEGPTVEIAGVNGPMRFQGDGLTLRLKGVRGETEIYSGGSDITIEDASGPLMLDNDSGSITVLRASGPLDVSGKKSVVRLEGLSGTLQLEAEGQEARVAWSAFPRQGESLVRNEGGGIVATLPSTGACRIEARTTFGRVDSEVPGVEADDTGKSSAGDVGKGASAIIRFVANGDVRLLALKPPPRRSRPAATPPLPR